VRQFARLAAALVAISAALVVVPGSTWADNGPLILTGPQTIQTDGANVQSYSFTGGTGRQPQAFSIGKPPDSSTPALNKAVAAGTHFQQASMVSVTKGMTRSVCLRDVLVSSVKPFLDLGQTPMESVTMSYNQIGFDPEGTAACANLGPPPKATVTTSLHGGTLSALVACLSVRCAGQVSLQLPSGACARTAGIMPSGRACAGKPIGIGRVALAAGRARTLRLTVPPGRLRRTLTRLGKGATSGIIAVLRKPGARGRPPGPPSRLKTFTAGRPVVLPKGLPAVQSEPPVQSGPPAPPPGGGTPMPPPGGSPAAPLATTLAITTCGPIGTFPRLFAGTITPPVAGLTITMTYTPPAGATIQQTVTTTAAGTFTDDVAATQPGTWSAQASFGGTPAYAASTSADCQFQGG
jgi:hypothetical protein